MTPRFAAAALLALTLSAPAAAQDCDTAHEAALALAEAAGFAVEAPGEVHEIDDRCRLEGLVLQRPAPGGLRLELAQAVWTADGLDPRRPLGGRALLDLELRGLRWQPVTGVAQMDFLLAEQFRRNLLDVVLVLAWDPQTAVLKLDTLKLDLPGRNALSARATLSQVHPGLLMMRGLAGFPVALDGMQLTIRNEGYFDGLLLPPMAGYLAEGGANPAARLAQVQLVARQAVARLPESAFPPPTKEALRALIDAAPVPWGRAELRVETAGGLRLRPMAELVLGRGTPDPEALRQAVEGVRVVVRYQPWQGWEE